MELLSSYPQSFPFLMPSSVDGHVPASSLNSWVAVREISAASGKGLYHLRKLLFLLGQGFTFLSSLIAGILREGIAPGPVLAGDCPWAARSGSRAGTTV